ncbi:hypothetical protein PQR59_32785 [Paraburkholderia graminis]
MEIDIPAPAGPRLHFVLDFAYATGLRVGELVGARLGKVEPMSGAITG